MERYSEVNYEQMKQILRVMLLEKGMPAVPNIQSGAGLGKTSLVRSFRDDAKIGMVEVMTAAELAEPGDLTGQPIVVNGVMHYAPPHWADLANQLANDYQVVILLFDDVTRVPAQIQQSLMPCFLDRRVGQYKLKDNIRPVLTSNPNNEHYATRELDLAQLERIQTFRLILDFEIFIQYAMRNQWNPEWVTFMRAMPECVELDGKGISPRTAEFCNQALTTMVEQGHHITSELTSLRIDAVIGQDLRVSFIESCKTQLDIISPENLIKGSWTKAQENLLRDNRPDLMQLTYFRLATFIHKMFAQKGTSALTTKEAGNVRKFILEFQNDELALIFLKSIPKEMNFVVLDVDSMEELRGRVWGKQ